MISQAAPARGSAHRRSRRRLALGVIGIGALGLVACAPNNTPPSYDDVAESSFMQSCSGDVPEYQGTTTTLAGSDYCACAYQVFVQNVPYNDDDKANRKNAEGQPQFAGYEGKTYLQYNTDLKNDPNALAPDIQAKLESCRTDPAVVPTPTGTMPTPTGTTPGTVVGEPS